MAQPRFPNGGAVAALAATAVTTAAVSIVTLNRVKDLAVDASLHGRPFGVAMAVQSVRPVDFVLMALAALCVLDVLWLQLRRQALTRLVQTVTPAEAWVVLTTSLAWTGHAYLSPGVLLGGDMATHISRFHEVAQGLRQGRLSDWTNYQYAGASLLWFTGPLTYVVGGVLAFVLRDAVLAMKALLFVLHLCAGWAFYAMLRRMAFGLVPAVLAAAGFAGSFAVLHMFLYRGVAPQAFTLLFLVLLFAAADGLLRGPALSRRWVHAAAFALVTAAMIVNHQPHALYAAMFLAVFGAVALATGLWRWRGVPLLVVAGGLGAITSVVAVVPILLESDAVMIEPERNYFTPRWPTPTRLLNLVRWHDTATAAGTDYWAYLGLGLVVFAVAAVVALVTGRLRPERRALVLAALAALVPEFILFNPVVRDIMFMLLFVGLLAAVGLEFLVERRVLTGRWLVAALAVMLLDLASTSVQPILRTDKGFLIEAGQYLERVAPNERVMQVGVAADGRLTADIGPDGGAISYAATVQRVAGNHNMAASRLHNFMAGAMKLAEAQLQATGAIDDDLRRLLGTYNITRIVCDTPIALGCPARFQGTRDDPVLGRFVPLPGAPVLFARTLLELAPLPESEKPLLWPVYYEWPWEFPRIRNVEAALRAFQAAERPDPAARIAAVIPVQDPLPPAIGSDKPFRPVLSDYAVTLDRVTARIESDGPGWVQLSHPWLPSTVATVNGAAIRPLRGTIDLIVLPLAAGTNVIELREGATTPRVASGLVSLAGLLTIAIAAALLARHDRRVPG